MSDQRRARSARTEEAIIAAATALLLERGYAGTSLSEVARRAGVSDRTVYVRFAGKAELLKRVIDVAVVGDTAGDPLADRDWMVRSMSAPTLDERIGAFAGGVAGMQTRLVPLVAVGVEVEGAEPLIAEQARSARLGNHRTVLAFWQSLVRDGLVARDLDVAWVAETTMLMSASETALLRGRTFGQTGYAAWLNRLLHLLARGEGGVSRPG